MYLFLRFLCIILHFWIPKALTAAQTDSHRSFPPDTLGGAGRRGDSGYERLLRQQRELLSTNALLKKTISDLQYRFDLECKQEDLKPSSMKKQLLKLRTELEGMKEFVQHSTDTRAITNAMEKAVLSARSSALESRTDEEKTSNF